MDPADIEKAIHDGIAMALESQLPVAVQTAVDSAVNGKIKALSEKMSPIADAYNKWLSWKRVAVVGIGVFLALGSFLSTATDLWGLLSAHFVVK
jgi:hypothetical protein